MSGPAMQALFEGLQNSPLTYLIALVLVSLALKILGISEILAGKFGLKFNNTGRRKGEVVIPHYPASARAYTDKVVLLSARIRENQRSGLIEAMMVAGDEGLQQYMAQIEQDAIDFAATLGQEDALIFMSENDIAMARIEPALHRAIRRAMVDNHIPCRQDQTDFTAYVKMKCLTFDGVGMQIRRTVVWHRPLHDRFLAFSRDRDQQYMDILLLMFDRANVAEQEMLEQIAKDQQELDSLVEHYCNTAQFKADSCA